MVTNSLAANDVAAVHGGYMGYRVPLLKAGVQLYELKANGQAGDGSLFGSSGASLHTKALLIDDRRGFVGSFNLDPRSAKLNSEMGLVVNSPILASQLLQLYQDVRSNSYEVSLDDRGRLRWRYQDGDRLTELHDEPDASLWLKLSLKLMAPFAPDELL